MENAAKALVLAGGILISIIVVSLMFIMINNVTSYQEAELDIQRVDQVAQFNQQFQPYMKDTVGGNELYTLISKITDYNARKEEEGYETMEVTIHFGDENNRKKLTRATDSSGNFINYIFTHNDMTFNGKKNDIYEDLKEYTSISYGSTTRLYLSNEVLDELCIAYEKIFLDEGSLNNQDESEIIEKKIDSINIINSYLGENLFNVSTNSLDYIWNNNIKVATKNYGNDGKQHCNLKRKVLEYHELKEFKRAKFRYNGNATTYSANGRLKRFEFTYIGQTV